MGMLASKSIFGLVMILAYSQLCNGQFEKDLQIQQQELSQKIDASNHYLDEVKKSQSVSLQELQVIKQNIEDRRSLVEVLETQRIDYDQQIDLICSELDSIHHVKDSLNLEYYNVLAVNYKRQMLVTPVHLLISSESLASLLTDNIQVDHYKHYIDRKKLDYVEVEKVSETLLKSYQAALDQNTKQQIRLRKEKEAIGVQLEQQQAIMAKLKKKEDEVRSQLNESEHYQRQVNQRIEQFIKRDIARDPSKSASIESSVSSAKPAYKSQILSSIVTQEIKPQSLPVTGTIISKFGRHRHPTLTDVYIVNSGIDFAFSGSQDVLAIASGTVAKVEPNGEGNLVLISSGEGIYHVYSIVMNPTIVEGQSVARGQSIGTVISELHFEIWDGKRKIDPEKVLNK